MIIHHSLPSDYYAAPKGVTGAQIIELAADVFGVNVKAIKSPRRQRSVAFARFAAYAAMRDFTTKSFPEIGKCIGDRDHTTIMYGLRRARGLMASDPEFCARYLKLCRKIEGRDNG